MLNQVIFLKKMGTVPTQQIACTEIIDKMLLIEQTKKLNACGLSRYFSRFTLDRIKEILNETA